MKFEKSVFEKTYKNYLEQLRTVSFGSVSHILGAELNGNLIKIPLFDNEYRISNEKITDSSGKKPSYDVCVILSKYILLCPEKIPQKTEWISFKNFKDSGPLVNYFTNAVEYAIALYFSEKLNDLVFASGVLGGYMPTIDVKYDFTIQFDALPRIPIIMLYNDKDEEFPPKCTVLFERRAEKYLDAECLAMLGRHMFDRLLKAQQFNSYDRK